MPETPTPPIRRFLDPAAIPLLAGAAVLVLAGVWLWATPRPVPPPNPTAQAVATLERRIAALEAFDARLAGVEQRRLPDLAPLDGGGLPVMEGDPARAPMGVAGYRRARDGATFVFVGGKGGPAEGYVVQYRLEEAAPGVLQATRVRAFGAYSGRKEIEAIAVDAEREWVYYSDEGFGVRKYAADPEAPDGNAELALLGATGFAGDHEGIAIRPGDGNEGAILVSNQQAWTFRVFAPEGPPGRPHAHQLRGSVRLSARETDGCEISRAPLPGFPGGLFVAMSDDRTFHYYAWDDLRAALGRESP